MKTYQTTVLVLRETPSSLVISPTHGESHSYKTAHGTYNRTVAVRINKKHILEGSDKLGIPVANDKEDERVSFGLLVIPEWLAKQRSMWDREMQELPMLAHNAEMAEDTQKTDTVVEVIENEE